MNCTDYFPPVLSDAELFDEVEAADVAREEDTRITADGRKFLDEITVAEVISKLAVDDATGDTPFFQAELPQIEHALPHKSLEVPINSGLREIKQSMTIELFVTAAAEA